MTLEGRRIRLRAVEPEDVETMYRWENDPEVWRVSGTLAPFSRHTLMQFVEEQRCDLYRTRQLRLIIETPEGTAVGTLDLFEFDPLNRRAGVGILIYDKSLRGRGYASEALGILEGYAREALSLHQLWCEVGADNEASLRLFERAGYLRTGRKRDWTLTPEGFRDLLTLQLIMD
ncbi:MAG: GNAT family N-acetyltransferase [Alistipes sp.]|nr:GNAT family N-acetyltransferase [Alistipes senegalensis]MCM1249914.1 GNAT family N-acetyltransferase [Alistipes sp.]